MSPVSPLSFVHFPEQFFFFPDGIHGRFVPFLVDLIVIYLQFINTSLRFLNTDYDNGAKWCLMFCYGGCLDCWLFSLWCLFWLF